MNGKHYVGNKAASVTGYDEIGPITGVTITVDSGTFYTAGVLTGYVISINCPYGTQDMANAIIAEIYGKTYRGYQAEGAILKPQAELGDGVTIGDIYSVLAYRRVEFGPGFICEISAPGENELDHEYQYTGTTDKQINNDVESLKSYLNQSLGILSDQVTTLTGRVQALTETMEQMTNAITRLEARVSALEGR